MTHPAASTPAQLSAEQKRALLKQKLAKAAQSEFPLSHGQNALWFLHEMTPASAAYNIAFAVRIRSALDVARLRQAFQTLILRHPALRTTFTSENGKPVQVVHGHKEFALAEVDASAWDEAALHGQIVDAYRQPFDLAAGPLFRAHLFRVDDLDTVMLLSAHHIIGDGWSLWMILDEWRQLYELEPGASAAFAPLKLTYADHVARQNAMLDGPRGDALRTYWHGQLAGTLPHLDLPTDRPRPAVLSYRGASATFRLSPQLSGALKALARDEGATLYTVLLAAFHVLLYRYSHQDRILVGSPMAGRTESAFTGVVGYFVNLVVLAADIDGARPFQDFLAQTRERVLGALAHQDYPFSLLVEKLQGTRDPGRNPLVQAVFTLQKSQQSDDFLALMSSGEGNKRLEWKNLTLEPYELMQQEGQFDVTLEMAEAGDTLAGAFKYSSDLFDAATIERMAGHFTRLLHAITANTATAIDDLPLLDSDERHRVLSGWDAVAAAYPDVDTLHRTFERQAEATPAAVAVVCDGAALRYGDLNARANQVAHFLRARGVGPDVLVGMCVDRSLDMIVGLLGILKSGGAYVPLDPVYPAERLAYMLDDARPALLLTQSHLLAGLPPSTPPVLCLDAPGDALAALPRTNPNPDAGAGAGADNLAYVIYTSGSTGKPKGALVTHRNVARLFAATDASFGFGPDDVWTLFHSYAFDFSVWEIWGALLHGGKLVVVPFAVSRSPDQFLALLAHERVTILNQTPSAFQQLIAADARQGEPVPLALRRVIFGGEALRRTALAPWFAARGDDRPLLVNMYGITETTVHVTYCALSGADVESASVGRPIADLRAYILDGRLNPVPVGVAGEMYIAGDGVARGYLNRPDLTAERFVPNPFSAVPGARMYKTGDLARFLPDGNIDYLGRADHQVKVRGFRIELAEIESALAPLPGVRDSIVLAREDVPGDQRLAAYVVPRDGATVAADDLRAALARSLPDYMVPAHFVLLDRMPLTPNGKIDRKALPAPDMTRGDAGYVAPRTPSETAIAAIWCDVLGLDRVGVEDDFFALGGHSLLATQVVSRLRSAFDVDLPLRALFEAPTVAGFAQRLDAAAGTTLPPLRPVPRDGAPALSFAQARLWFLDQFESGTSLYNMPAALRLTGRLDADALARALQGVVDRHDVLRTTFAVADDHPVQIIAPALALPLPVIDLSTLPHAEREAHALWLAQDEAQTPFDLATGPLIRTRLLRLAPDEHMLLVTLHHIISDGWSMGVLVREIGALYAGSAPLPPLPVQYADFAHWQRQWLSGDVLDTQLAYWKARLDGAPALLALPTDRPRPPLQSYRGALLPFTVPAAVAAGLHAVSQRAHATLFMTLAAAFDVLLARYSGQSDICLGTPVANRGVAETQDLIGLFVNTLVLRAQVDNNVPFTALLDQVRATALEAYSHQDLPFERLVEAVQPERSLDHAPLFQVMLALQETSAAGLHLPGLTLAQVDTGIAPAKFDLTLHVAEDRGALQATFEYNTDLFDAATIERMAAHLTRLLAAIAADPACRVGDLPMLADAERDRLLRGWNDTATAYPGPMVLHQLVEAQASRTPDAVAVIFEDVRLSYGELDARANQLAHHLRALGAGPDAVVAICADRSHDMVVGLLGILKAGAAYLPLDPAYPAGRLAHMLADAAPAAVLTQAHLLARLPAADGAVVCLDAPDEAWRAMPTSNPGQPVLPQHLAYVIYTSGSTGLPKGVGIDHAGIVNRLRWMQQAYGLSAADRVLQKTPYSFDVSVWEFFWPLTCGAGLVVARPGGHQDVDYLTRLIADQAVTTLHFVPPMLEVFLNTADVARCASVRNVMCSGQALPRELQQRFFAKFPDTGLHNLYGPTEASVDVTAWQCAPSESACVPIGRPIANTQIHLLDERLEPVPVGVAGELYIAGTGLARGYLNRPGLTAERFVPNPFAAAPGARMYRTGDLARYLPDGAIEYLGRIDHQVKIRGLRIELGEIESTLAGLAAVRDCVVLARADAPGDARLVAYVVLHADAAASVGALRMGLARTLPDYMVPAHIVILDALPLTPNGKIDRRALPAPDVQPVQARYAAPRTPVEAILADIWAEVLDVGQVGIHDNFFELGGHSLLAVTLTERMRRAGLAVDVRRLFATPTIAALAGATDAAPRVAVPANGIPDGCDLVTPDMLPLVTLSPDEIAAVAAAVPGGAPNIQDIYPLAPLQEGILFHHLMSQTGDAYILPTLLEFDGKDRLDRFIGALQAVIERHDVLRTAVVWQGLPEPVQVVLRHAPLRIEPAHVDGDADVAGQLCTRYHPSRYRLDVREAPMLRGFIAEDARNGRWLLRLLSHHMIEDITSIQIMMTEIHAIMAGQQAALPAPVPFRNAVAQARLAAPEAGHERFFTAMLGDVTEPTAPFGLLDAPQDGAGIDEARRAVDPALAQRLRRQARTLGVGAASLVHLAWAHVLARLSGRTDVVFGTVLFGRTQGGDGADRAVGVYINTLPIRIAVAGTSVRAGVRATHDLLADMLQHEHASLAAAQRCSGIAAPAPLFSSLLNYRHSAAHGQDGATAWDGMRIVDFEERTNYPLLLSVDDDGQGFTLVAQIAAGIDAGRICDYMHTALDGLAQALDTPAETPADAIDVLPPAERTRLLVEWNETGAPPAAAATIPQLFEAQAGKTPDATAVVCGDARLTYAELDGRANQLAHYLRAQGVGPDRLVGVCVERSQDMVVALLGVLKAGGAYIPLDPAYPADRLADMLADGQPDVLLTQSHLLANLPATGCTVVCLDSVTDSLAVLPRTRPRTATLPAHLAYVIYTSGSTGRPKGVAIQHANAAAFIGWAAARFGRASLDKVLASTSLCFDLSIFEIFVPLCEGGAVYVVRDILELVGAQQPLPVTLVNTVPSAIAELHRSGAIPDTVATINLAGEALQPALVAQLLRLGHVDRIVNLYGPTEDTTYSTCHEMARGSSGHVAIGRPIAGSQAYLLDHGLEPVPAGVAGELYLAGAGLARGYLNRPDLTAERFLPDPFGAPGGRMYRTGDLARYLPDGTIEYLGRIDHQVKIRGHRIELGEIEARLLLQDAVRACVVLAREDAPGDKRLAAYVVPQHGTAADAEAARLEDTLRAALAQALPGYMVPAHFVVLDQLPLTPNGKVDRKALPAPDALRHQAGYVAPRTDTEQILADIWAEVLNVERVGMHDSFFDLGGNSLLAIRLITEVRETFQVALMPQALFNEPTIAATGALIEQLILEEVEQLSEEEAIAIMNEEDKVS